MFVTGKLLKISETQQVSPTFSKREIVLETEEKYPQKLLIEFTQDNTNLLNQFKVGDLARVSINLRGREWTSPKGEIKYFNSIQGWKLEFTTSEVTNADQNPDRQLVADDMPF